MNQEYVHKKLLDKRKKLKPKFQAKDLVRTADLKKTFSKSDTTNWFYKIYEITEIINVTIPSYRIDNLPERYDEALLKKTELSMKENKDVRKALFLKQNQYDVVHLSLCLLICLLVLDYKHILHKECFLKT